MEDLAKNHVRNSAWQSILITYTPGGELKQAYAFNDLGYDQKLLFSHIVTTCIYCNLCTFCVENKSV